MRAWVVPPGSSSSADLRRVDRHDPQPGHGQVLVRVRAVSLNYRDQLVVSTYFGGPNTRDLVPLSDGAGDVAAVGAGVSRVRVGDRVAGLFFQRAPDGAPGAPPRALGSPLDGTLADYIVLYEDGLVVIPAGLSYEEAACLPCAAVTAWHALFGRTAGSRRDTVLVLGTGGVSIFSRFNLRARGTSDRHVLDGREAQRVIALGASDAINYRRTPDWEKEVRLSGGRGVDCAVEVGGGGTFARSLQALGRGGKVCLIGFVAGREGDTSPFPLMYKAGSLHGIFVGDGEMFEEMNRAIAVNHIEPVIDRCISVRRGRTRVRPPRFGAVRRQGGYSAASGFGRTDCRAVFRRTEGSVSMESNRREFITRSSLAVAAGALVPGRLFGQQAPAAAAAADGPHVCVPAPQRGHVHGARRHDRGSRPRMPSS